MKVRRNKMMAGVRRLLSVSSLYLLLGSFLLGCGGKARALVIPVDANSGNDSLCLAAQDLGDTATEYPAGPTYTTFNRCFTFTSSVEHNWPAEGLACCGKL